ncbi:MAG: hypothetical protein KGZ40_00450 [Clostridiales bacterium]|nr:hypothetical protein [Clostridiales bacterium]
MYLNDVACWRCVPANVWRYTIGGYLVIKKWLSYRGRYSGEICGRKRRATSGRCRVGLPQSCLWALNSTRTISA